MHVRQFDRTGNRIRGFQRAGDQLAAINPAGFFLTHLDLVARRFQQNRNAAIAALGAGYVVPVSVKPLRDLLAFGAFDHFDTDGCFARLFGKRLERGVQRRKNFRWQQGARFVVVTQLFQRCELWINGRRSLTQTVVKLGLGGDKLRHVGGLRSRHIVIGVSENLQRGSPQPCHPDALRVDLFPLFFAFLFKPLYVGALIGKRRCGVKLVQLGAILLTSICISRPTGELFDTGSVRLQTFGFR